ncbi:hypothetical protein DFQ14_107168 [Halopolyspora algeriensis]|uniref:Cell division protein FtsL n=1 Tax=Halopolyspora algeriensis TaxID=1500506 RepID=A0A368VNI4_9ACTN|nr:hypothetical protein [Halopolyspora algeriensis]RCW43279.1 hypothetical protein DFQ14_107168 [Halopolyspora algeriensis]TQM56338.1 hypothetical protein FHU43_1132 [Halopolyspora algeriensis]
MTAPTRARTSAARKDRNERAAEGGRKSQGQRNARNARTAERERVQAPERTRARHQHRVQRTRSARQPPDQRQSQRRRKTKEHAKAQQPKATKARQLQTKVTSSRLSFVVAVMTVLVAGIVSTLWLSISAVGNSYELQRAEARVNALSERKETLLAQVSKMSSTPAVQRRAREIGLVPGPEPAHLKVQPDGSVTVLGEPEPAKAPAKAPPPPEHAASGRSSQQQAPDAEARRP